MHSSLLGVKDREGKTTQSDSKHCRTGLHAVHQEPLHTHCNPSRSQGSSNFQDLLLVQYVESSRCCQGADLGGVSEGLSVNMKNKKESGRCMAVYGR
jgi:hypothetical protein